MNARKIRRRFNENEQKEALHFDLIMPLGSYL